MRDHLRRDPNSALLLTEAQAHLKQIFGVYTQAALDAVQEPEAESAMLFARIRADQDWRASFDKMDRFDEEWWLDASSSFPSRLEFSIAL